MGMLFGTKSCGKSPFSKKEEQIDFDGAVFSEKLRKSAGYWPCRLAILAYLW
jgi:hypothetical protein